VFPSQHRVRLKELATLAPAKRPLREGLESGTIVPPGVQARIVAMQPSFEVAGRRLQVDAIVEFTVKDLPNKPIKAVIEMKSRLPPHGS
jgi:hypothetical protein